MSCGSAAPSLSASAPYPAHVPGRNCIGPTARSKAVSPSWRPPSESRIVAVPARVPSRRMPRIGGCTRPLLVTCEPAKRPWLLSTRPMAASTVHGSLQDGSVRASEDAALVYACCARCGMPDDVRPLVSRSP
jgi:hypothetical protein